jgi:hypothetical protein
MDVFSGFTLLAFRRHVTIVILIFSYSRSLFLKVQPQAQLQVSSRLIHAGKSGNGAGVSSSFFHFSCK